MPEVNRANTLLSLQRALLGEITPGMRAVSVRWSSRQILIRVFHDGPWAALVEEDFDASAVTQVVADFPNPEQGDPEILYEFVRLDGDARLPQDLPENEAFAYARNNEKWDPRFG
jgi:hypothetical protein